MILIWAQKYEVIKSVPCLSPKNSLSVSPQPVRHLVLIVALREILLQSSDYVAINGFELRQLLDWWSNPSTVLLALCPPLLVWPSQSHCPFAVLPVCQRAKPPCKASHKLSLDLQLSNVTNCCLLSVVCFLLSDVCLWCASDSLPPLTLPSPRRWHTPPQTLGPLHMIYISIANVVLCSPLGGGQWPKRSNCGTVQEWR